MSLDIDGEPLSTVVFDGQFIIMDNGDGQPQDDGGVSGSVQRGNGARVDVIKKQQSFMEKIIGVRNAQCELYLANTHRAIDKHAAASMRHIQENTNQLKYDYKLMQVSQQRNELAVKQRQDPEVDLEYEEFLINQTQKYLIYNPNLCTYIDKSQRFPPRSGKNLGGEQRHITPTLAKARKLLQDSQLHRSIPARRHSATGENDRNVHFRLDTSLSVEEDEEVNGAKTVTHHSHSCSSGEGSSSSYNEDEMISQEPDKLFIPRPKVPNVSQATMDHIKKRLKLRNLVEKMEMAPYQVLLDENKELPPGKCPDPTKLFDAEGRLYGLVKKDRLPKLYRSQTTTPPGKREMKPDSLRSRSDAFFREPLHLQGPEPPKTAAGRLGVRQAKSSHQRRRSKSLQSDVNFSNNGSVHSLPVDNKTDARSRYTTSAKTIKTRPLTHAMLKKEKTEIDQKLGSFFSKLSEIRHVEKVSKSQEACVDSQSTGSKDRETTDELTKLDIPTMEEGIKIKPPLLPRTSATDFGLIRVGPPMTPKSQRGIPNHAAERSQRHTATFKLRKVVAKLMKSKSKMELMELDKLRDMDPSGTGAPTQQEDSADTDAETT